MKKLFIIILIFLCALELSSCRDEQQERLDNRNTIERFLKRNENADISDARLTFWLPNFKHMIVAKGGTMYELLDTIEYTEIALSKTPIKEYGSLVFSYWRFDVEDPQKFALLDDLETIYVFDVIDGILYIKWSYRYYRIKKEDGQKILELAERIVEEQNNESY